MVGHRRKDTQTHSVNQSLRDIVALSTLPVIWSGAAPERIAESLAAALFTTIDSAFIHVAFIDSNDKPLASVVQVNRYETDPALAARIGPTILEWARTHDPHELLVLPRISGPGTLRVTTRPIGWNGELGAMAAAFYEEDAPTADHHLVLNVAASQAVTAIQNARLMRSLRESEERFRGLMEASAQIVWTTDLEGNMIEDSPSWRAFTGQTLGQLRGWGWLEVLHPDDQPRVAALWRLAIKEKKPVDMEYRIHHVGGTWRWTAVRAVPLVNPDGSVREWVGMNIDITERKHVETQLKEQMRWAALRADVNAALVQIKAPSDMLQRCAEILVQHLNIPLARIWTLNEKDKVLELAASAGAYRQVDGAEIRVPLGQSKVGWIAENRKPLLNNEAAPDKAGSDLARPDGMVGFAGYPLIVEDRLVGVAAVFAGESLTHTIVETLGSVATGIALGIERMRAESARKEQSEIVETINRTGQLLAAELDMQKLVQAVTDAATELSGARFGSFFYNAYTEQGGAYMLYTLSGAPREAFAHFPMPRATDLFGPTFRGEGTICIDDVQKDARFGKNSPYFGMPAGHLPVTSYLAVPVISRSGEVLGGLFFGHPKPGQFSERAARIVEGLAAQAAIAMDNAQLFLTAQKALAEREELLNCEQAARKQAEAASRMKDEFLATVSHELRTPLSSILGWANMLRLGHVENDKVNVALETIERNARAQDQLINDLLDVSRIITGKLRLDVRPIDPVFAIENAIEVIRPAADAKGVRVQKVLDTGVGAISGDADRLQQVVWNLLSNAIKFTPRGGRVQVRLERIDSHIEINVSDTGIGIRRDFLPYVFDHFRQADSTTTRAHGGLGLGLAIVRHLVELHGGEIRADSAGEGQGATFVVKLPLLPVYTRRDAVADEPDVGLKPAADERLDGLRVLLVDDERDTCELLRTMVSQCGAQVTAASSAGRAMEELMRERFDLIVSDIGMPGTDGYELMQKVRRLPADRGGRTPAVALTAYARPEDRLRALRAGYQAHVKKPIEYAELIAVMASVANR